MIDVDVEKVVVNRPKSVKSVASVMDRPVLKDRPVVEPPVPKPIVKEKILDKIVLEHDLLGRWFATLTGDSITRMDLNKIQRLLKAEFRHYDKQRRIRITLKRKRED